MNRFLSSRLIAAAALAIASLGAVTAAEAHPNVFLSIGLPLPPLPLPGRVYVEPAPVYVQPAPVYVQPAPEYAEPRPVYAAPAYGYERSWGPSYRYDFERERAWRRAEWQRREWEEHRHHERDRFPSRGQ
jgi:PXPV repeat (3 copies)